MSKALSASMEKIIWFLIFNLLMWHLTVIDLQILKNQDKSHLILAYDSFNVLLDSDF